MVWSAKQWYSRVTSTLKTKPGYCFKNWEHTDTEPGSDKTSKRFIIDNLFRRRYDRPRKYKQCPKTAERRGNNWPEWGESCEVCPTRTKTSPVFPLGAAFKRALAHGHRPPLQLRLLPFLPTCLCTATPAQEDHETTGLGRSFRVA